MEMEVNQTGHGYHQLLGQMYLDIVAQLGFKAVGLEGGGWRAL
jgi:hypothetical protein